MSIIEVNKRDSRFTKVGEPEWNRFLWIALADIEPGSHRQGIHA